MNYVKANSEHLERMTYLDYRGTAAYSVDKSRLCKANGKTQYDRAIQAHPEEIVDDEASVIAPWLRP